MQGRNWMRWLLIASLGLNLLVAGALLGAWMRHDAHPPRADRFGGPLTHAFSPQDRRAIGRALWRDGETAEGARRADQAEAYAALLAAARAQPFDRNAARDALARLAALAAQRDARGRALTVERLAQMDAGARAAYADRLQAALERRDARRLRHE